MGCRWLSEFVSIISFVFKSYTFCGLINSLCGEHANVKRLMAYEEFVWQDILSKLRYLIDWRLGSVIKCVAEILKMLPFSSINIIFMDEFCH